MLPLHSVELTQIALNRVEALVYFDFQLVDALAEAAHVGAIEKYAAENGQQGHGELDTEEDGEQWSR